MTIPNQKISVCWLRRDLRLFDQAALYHALKSENPVLCLFIFDKNILDKLDDKADRRLHFIHQTLLAIKADLLKKGSDLLVLYDEPQAAWKTLLDSYSVAQVFVNRDYEPYARNRDSAIKDFLTSKGITFHDFKDQVIFEPGEVLKDDGKPYTVYTPFANKWLSRKNSFYLKSYPTEAYYSNFFNVSGLHFPSIQEFGFKEAVFPVPTTNPQDSILTHYADTRNFPALENGTSHLGLHLRFGTLSIRELACRAEALNLTFLKELIWREFFMQILYFFPHVENGAFKKEYDRIAWRNNPEEFKKWCEGNTGYPIVDAGMRELNATGFMHNRVRMVTASFLTKHLLIDWRWGEHYFAQKLLDFDLSANNGNWQWAAGCGCDAAPYFRVFNPYTQAEKFDPDGKYIRKWVPEIQGFGYPQPMVDHKMARVRVLSVYKEALGK